MPARRFWMMERQIDRIRSENDIRQVQLHGRLTPPQSQEQANAIQDYIGQLTLEIGEKATIRRSVVVAPEADAKHKFMRIIGG